MSGLTLRDITKKYIREYFDINEERTTKSVKVSKGYVEMPLGEMTPAEFSAKLIESFIEGTERIKVSQYGYSGAIKIKCFALKDIIEQDDEVVVRLQKELKAKIKAEQYIEKEKVELIRLKEEYEKYEK